MFIALKLAHNFSIKAYNVAKNGQQTGNGNDPGKSTREDRRYEALVKIEGMKARIAAGGLSSGQIEAHDHRPIGLHVDRHFVVTDGLGRGVSQ